MQGNLAVAAQARASWRDEGPSAHVIAGYPAAIDEIVPVRSRAFLRRAWLAAGGSGGAVTLIGQRADGSVFAALPTLPVGPPVAMFRTIPGSYWPFRGAPLASDASEAELAGLLGGAAARSALGRAWRLGPIYRSDPAVKLLVKAARHAGWTVLKRSLGTTFELDVAAAQEAGGLLRPAKLKRVRAAEAKLAATGTVSYRTICGEDWTSGVLDALGRIEAHSWVGTATDGSGAKFLSAAQRLAWRDVLADPVLAQMLSALLLEVDGTPIAFSFDLTVGRHQYGIASSYDAAFARFAPGKLVTYRQLADALAAGVERIDWGAGDSGYKRELGATAGPEIVDCLFVRGRALAALLRRSWRDGTGDASPAAGLGRTEQALIASLGMAAAAAAFIE